MPRPAETGASHGRSPTRDAACERPFERRLHSDAAAASRVAAGTGRGASVHARPLERVPGTRLRDQTPPHGVASELTGVHCHMTEEMNQGVTPAVARGSSDVIFTPLKFNNLTVKNRIFRSSVSGRFDNEDG